jgi:hypothetical protein
MDTGTLKISIRQNYLRITLDDNHDTIILLLLIL